MREVLIAGFWLAYVLLWVFVFLAKPWWVVCAPFIAVLVGLLIWIFASWVVARWNGEWCDDDAQE